MDDDDDDDDQWVLKDAFHLDSYVMWSVCVCLCVCVFGCYHHQHLYMVFMCISYDFFFIWRGGTYYTNEISMDHQPSMMMIII